jgi:hypothetical protein
MDLPGKWIDRVRCGARQHGQNGVRKHGNDSRLDGGVCVKFARTAKPGAYEGYFLAVNGLTKRP